MQENIADNTASGILIAASSLAQLENYMLEVEKGPLPQPVVDALDRAWMVSKAGAPNYWHLNLEYKYDTVKELYGKS